MVLFNAAWWYVLLIHMDKLLTYFTMKGNFYTNTDVKLELTAVVVPSAKPRMSVSFPMVSRGVISIVPLEPTI